MRARAARKHGLLLAVENSKDWKSTQWLLQKNFPAEFGDTPLIANQQNNFLITREAATEIDAQRKRVRAMLMEEPAADPKAIDEADASVDGHEGQQPASQAPRLSRHSDGGAMN